MAKTPSQQLAVCIDNDGYPDYAYAADTGGDIYRIDFVGSYAGRVPAAPDATWPSSDVLPASTS